MRKVSNTDTILSVKVRVAHYQLNIVSLKSVYKTLRELEIKLKDLILTRVENGLGVGFM